MRQLSPEQTIVTVANLLTEISHPLGQVLPEAGRQVNEAAKAIGSLSAGVKKMHEDAARWYWYSTYIAEVMGVTHEKFIADIDEAMIQHRKSLQ